MMVRPNPSRQSRDALLLPEVHGDVRGEAGELRLIVIVFFGFPLRKHPVFPRMDDVLTLLT